MFLDVGIVSPLFTCSGWGGHQELGLKIDLFKPLSLLSSPQRLDAHGQPWFCSPHKSVLVASACPPALPGRVRNPFFLEMKPPASQTPPHECPPASQAGPVLPASVPCQPPAPAPLTGLCGCHQPTRTFPLLRRWSAWALSRPCGFPLAWSSQEQTGEACGLV